MKYTKVIRVNIPSDLKRYGLSEIKDGVFLQTSDFIIEESLRWPDEDPAKKIDFASYPLWLTRFDMNGEMEGDPIGCVSVADALASKPKV